MKFIPHTGTTAFASYLAINLPFAPVADVRQRLERQLGRPLKHRDEAHITVITPPEFVRLQPYLAIDEINRIVADSIQATRFKVACTGRAQAVLEGELHSTYFLVVDSPQLHRIRDRIALLYKQTGGPLPAFTEDYHPHITVGFTHRDLYAADGAIKDRRSCLKNAV
ncbi:MAG: hypothetical protein HKN70_07155 [Gammaproteobacteria bacterium]|nr:hypothetical protein [Gammaproteobacteria bacterium]